MRANESMSSLATTTTGRGGPEDSPAARATMDSQQLASPLQRSEFTREHPVDHALNEATFRRVGHCREGLLEGSLGRGGNATTEFGSERDTAVRTHHGYDGLDLVWAS